MMNLTEAQRKELVDASVDAKNFSYSPYSKFRVGCALLTTCGKIFKGCNVENVSYGLCICAERTAYTKAVSEGYKSFKAVVVSTDVEGDAVTFPCGACRQFMAEFGDVGIIAVSKDGGCQTSTLNLLLPKAFDSDALDSGKNKSDSSS